MSKPSEKAFDLVEAVNSRCNNGMVESASGVISSARLIDAALAEARQEVPKERWRAVAFQESALASRLEAERDELAATVGRVRALADEWMFDTEFAHKAHYADELRDALRGESE